jgi:hypothetical protein
MAHVVQWASNPEAGLSHHRGPWSEATQNSLETEARSAQLAVAGMTAVRQAEELAQLRAAGRLFSEEQTEALVQSVLERQPHAVAAGR